MKKIKQYKPVLGLGYTNFYKNLERAYYYDTFLCKITRMSYLGYFLGEEDYADYREFIVVVKDYLKNYG